MYQFISLLFVQKLHNKYIRIIILIAYVYYVIVYVLFKHDQNLNNARTSNTVQT